MARILIIDDNEQDRIIIKRFLKKAGYADTSEAANGEEGLEKAAAERPSLIITDTMLPGIDGFEVCSRLKKSSERSNAKIIVMTGAIDAVDAVKAKKAGADDYCVKTSDAAPLLEAVRKLL